MKTHADMHLKASFDGHFFRKYDIGHFIFYLRDSNVLLLFRPRFGTYFDFVKAFEILGLHVRA
jgi:hypothetical protein